MKTKVLNKSLSDYQDPFVSQYPLYRMRVDTLHSLRVILTLTVSVSFLAMPLGSSYSRVAPREGDLGKQLIGKKIKLHLEFFIKPHFVFVLVLFLVRKTIVGNTTLSIV